MEQKSLLNNSLVNYLKQGKTLHVVNRNTLKKGTLALLTPLAASALIGTDLNAQCGVGSFDPSGGYYSNGGLDVDGDGSVDFDFDVFCYSSGGVVTGLYLYMTVAGTMNFGNTVASGAPITTGNAGTYTGGFANLLSTTNSAGIGSGSFFVPISTDAGAVGFIEIVFDDAGGCPGFTVNIAATGMETGPDGMATAGDCATLPIDLVNFDVRADNKGNLLSWNTRSEINNEGFEILRSEDGRSFEKIGWKDGEGTSTVEMDYQFLDKNRKSNVEYFYRLKQMDYSGSYKYSEIISATHDNQEAVTISKLTPNPAKEQSRLEVFSRHDNIGQIEIFSSTGKLMDKSDISLTKGENIIPIDSADLGSGTYYVKVSVADVSSYQKLIVL